MNPLILLLLALAHHQMQQRQAPTKQSPAAQGSKGTGQGHMGMFGPYGAQKKAMTAPVRPTASRVSAPVKSVGTAAKPSPLMQLQARGPMSMPGYNATRPLS